MLDIVVDMVGGSVCEVVDFWEHIALERAQIQNLIAEFEVNIYYPKCDNLR